MNVSPVKELKDFFGSWILLHMSHENQLRVLHEFSLWSRAAGAHRKLACCIGHKVQAAQGIRGHQEKKLTMIDDWWLKIWHFWKCRSYLCEMTGHHGHLVMIDNGLVIGKGSPPPVKYFLKFQHQLNCSSLDWVDSGCGSQYASTLVCNWVDQHREWLSLFNFSHHIYANIMLCKKSVAGC